MLCSNYNRLWGLQWLWPNFRLGDLWLHGSHCWRLWLGSRDLALGLWLSPWLLWCWLRHLWVLHLRVGLVTHPRVHHHDRLVRSLLSHEQLLNQVAWRAGLVAVRAQAL